MKIINIFRTLKKTSSAQRIILAATALISTSALAQNIQRPEGGYWGGGYVLARPLKASMRGAVVQTMELEVSMGNRTSISSQYQGHTLAMSTRMQSVFDRFKTLDPNKEYIFQYAYPYPMNPIWEDTHYLVTNIFEMRTDFSNSLLPDHVETHQIRTGTYSAGTRTGIISEVFRWGVSDITCKVTLNVGGHSAHGQEENETFNIYGESNCLYAQNLMFYGKEVAIQYSQDYVEVWDGEDHIIHRLSVVNETPTTPIANQIHNLTYEQVRDQMMNDPVFLQWLRRSLQNPTPAPSASPTRSTTPRPTLNLNAPR